VAVLRRARSVLSRERERLAGRGHGLAAGARVAREHDGEGPRPPGGGGRIGERGQVRTGPVAGDGHFGTVRSVVRGPDQDAQDVHRGRSSSERSPLGRLYRLRVAAGPRPTATSAEVRRRETVDYLSVTCRAPPRPSI